MLSIVSTIYCARLPEYSFPPPLFLFFCQLCFPLFYAFHHIFMHIPVFRLLDPAQLSSWDCVNDSCLRLFSSPPIFLSQSRCSETSSHEAMMSLHLIDFTELTYGEVSV